MIATANDRRVAAQQGYQDAREFQRLLESHGKQDYEVFLNLREFATYDAMMISPLGRKSYIELKSRNIPIGKYNDCVVDLAKIVSLQKLAQDSGDKVFLVALYPLSGYVAIWEIREDEDYQPTTVYANSATVQYYGPKPKKQKQMVKLMLKDAKVYRHQFEQI